MQKNKRGDIAKWEQTFSPEIPDRGETSEIPGLPSGGLDMTRSAYSILTSMRKTVKMTGKIGTPPTYSILTMYQHEEDREDGRKTVKLAGKIGTPPTYSILTQDEEDREDGGEDWDTTHLLNTHHVPA